MRDQTGAGTLVRYLSMFLSKGNKRSRHMTQHYLEEDNVADQQAMRRLAAVIGGFIAATAILALVVGLTMG